MLYISVVTECSKVPLAEVLYEAKRGSLQLLRSTIIYADRGQQEEKKKKKRAKGSGKKCKQHGSADVARGEYQ